jgi:hypothetical protein
MSGSVVSDIQTRAKHGRTSQGGSGGKSTAPPAKKNTLWKTIDSANAYSADRSRRRK